MLKEDEEGEDVEAVTAQSCKCFSPCSSNNSEKRLLFPLRAGDDVLLPNEEVDLLILLLGDDNDGKSPPPPKLLLLPIDSMAMPDVKDEVVL